MMNGSKRKLDLIYLKITAPKIRKVSFGIESGESGDQLSLLPNDILWSFGKKMPDDADILARGKNRASAISPPDVFISYCINLFVDQGSILFGKTLKIMRIKTQSGGVLN